MPRIARRVRRIGNCALIACVLTIAARDIAYAQGERAAAPPRPGWLPRQITLRGDLTAAQRATAIARLEQIEDILLRIPELANPNGFEVLSEFFGTTRRSGPGQSEQPGYVVEYMLRLWFFYPTKAAGGEGCFCITITVNHGHVLGGSEISDEQGRAIYIEMARGDPLPLATQVYERLLRTSEPSFTYVLLTSGGELPWKSVSRAEYYNAVIFDIEGKGGAKLADDRAALTKTPYQVWMEGAADRKQQREHSIRTMEALKKTPAEIEQMRKRLEDNERQVTEQLKAKEAADRHNNDEALALLHSRTGRIRAELDSMSAAERNMPALIDATVTGGTNATGWRMTDRDSPRAWRVVTPNYDFWRARRSPVEVRSIMVKITATGTGLAAPGLHNALLKSFDKMDWTALNRVLDVPR
jgi:hypothetical protein